MARSRSIATDTRLDDAREFHVYLAHHGRVVKVGITAVERGHTRLLEQGALSSLFLSRGSLVAARRCEALLTTALGLPQQVTVVSKRSARRAPGTPSGRAADLLGLAERTAGLAWPPGQARLEASPVDHCPGYPLPDGGLTPGFELCPLAAGAVLAGEVACRVGRDVYLVTPDGILLVDTGLLQGWALTRAGEGVQFTAPVHRVETTKGADHDVLF